MSGFSELNLPLYAKTKLPNKNHICPCFSNYNTNTLKLQLLRLYLQCLGVQTSKTMSKLSDQFTKDVFNKLTISKGFRFFLFFLGGMIFFVFRFG